MIAVIGTAQSSAEPMAIDVPGDEHASATHAAMRDVPIIERGKAGIAGRSEKRAALCWINLPKKLPRTP